MAKKQSVWKWLVVGFAGVLAVGMIVGVASSLKGEEETRVLGAGDYATYALDDMTGKPDHENKGVLTSTAFYPIDDLKCELEKDATIHYQLNFYSADKEFISMKRYSENFDVEEIEELKAEGVVYVRIEIIPFADEDGIVGIFEKNGYVKQLIVEVQNEEVKEAAESEEE